MARDTRTRLNAELAHQYSESSGAAGRAVTPGRSSLTEDLVEKQDAAAELDGEQVEQAEAQGPEAEEPEREPRRSIFELPRKEPVKASLGDGTGDAADTKPRR